MLNPLPPYKESPSQTAGPYVHIGLTPNFAGIAVGFEDLGTSMYFADTVGERIIVTGRIIDGSGAPLLDGVVEVWQADSSGSYAGSLSPDANTGLGFLGWGRQATSPEGVFRFETVKPGPVVGPQGKLMAPHISLWIVARGINIGLHTRIYFEEEAELNASDPVLSRILDPRRRKTLVAQLDREGNAPRYTLDIRLQGEGETVFFDI